MSRTKVSSASQRGMHLIIWLCVFGVILFASFVSLFGSGLFTGEAQLAREGERAVRILVGSSAAAYAAALFFWGVTVLLVGGVWVYLLLRNAPRKYQFLGALSVGFLIMPFHILIGGIAAWSGVIPEKIFSEHVLTTLTQNTDTGYAILNMLAMLIIGVLLVIAREVVRTARHESQAYTPQQQ